MRMIVLTTWTLLALQANAQGTAADYQRAESFAQRFASKVLNERLTMNWLSGGKGWYVKALGDGKREFVLVDGPKAKKGPAFDHVRVAEALSKASGQAVDPTRIPDRQAALSPDATQATFNLTEFYTVNLKTLEVAKGRPVSSKGLQAFAPEEVPRSGGGGEQTSITFINQSKEPLKVWWVQDDGELREYKTLQPGEEWSSNTWVTHYWLVTRVDGTKLAAYKPDRNGSAALLDGIRVPFNPPKRREFGVSPNGQWQVVFEDFQARLVNVSTKEVRELTTDGSRDNRYQGPITWSPNSENVTFTQTEPEESHPLNIVLTTPLEQFQPKLTTRQYLKPGDKLAKPVICLYRIGEAAPGKVDTAPYSNPWDLDGERWLDNERFVFRYNQRGHQAMRLIQVDASSLSTKILINEEVKTFIDWTNKAFHQVLKDGNHAIWQSERSGWSHLYLHDLQSGISKPITQGNWVVRAVDRVDEEKRQIWFQASGMDADQDPYHVHFCRINFDGKELTRLTSGDGNHRVEYSPDGEWTLDSYSRVDMAPVHELRRVKDGKKVLELERADTAPLIAAGFNVPGRFVAKGRDGVTDIWGLIYFPTNYDPAKKYPVVEDIYAGPHSAHVPKNFHTNAGGMQVAELGFIVVRIDGMGTSNRSKAFHDVCWQNIADAGFPDRIAWIKAASAKYPAMDLSRVGIYGTSAGGQNTLHALLLHGDFYKVGIADCGCYDNRMDKIWWNEQWMGWPIGPHYEAQSGRTLAKNLQGKLLLLLGENDTNVDPASTYQVVSALIQANKDFEFVAIPNVGHGAVGHPYGRRKQRDFLVRHLLGVEPRAQ